MNRRSRLAAPAVLLVAALAACSSPEPASAGDVVVGVPEGTSTSTTGPVVVAATGPAVVDDVFVDGAASAVARPEPGAAAGLAPPDGAPWAPALPFRSAHAVPDDLVFVLVAGSDARPGEPLLRSRADSLHLLAVDPAGGQGTLLGLPRDSWVEIPGHGRGKINTALTLGGPDLLAATVRRLTGLPVHFYAVTGFTGLAAMVDELGGVDVFVDRRMDDRMSGARFERGWHRFTGAEALAYSRNRNDVANGDFSRSEHQGRLVLAALAKMRAEVGDDTGVARWVDVLRRHVRLDVPVDRLAVLGALARRLDPDRLRNVVAPGRIGTAGRQSVVYLTKEAARLFDDLRPDAVVGTPAPPPADSAPPATTTAPAPDGAGGDPPAATSSTTRDGTGNEPGATTSSTAPPGEDEPSPTTTTSPSGPVPGLFDDG